MLQPHLTCFCAQFVSRRPDNRRGDLKIGRVIGSCSTAFAAAAAVVVREGRALVGAAVPGSPGHAMLNCASISVWLCARLKRPLVTTWAALHDLWRFGYALLEMCAMVCAFRAVPSLSGTRCAQICTTIPGRFSGPLYPQVMILAFPESFGNPKHMF